MPDTFTVQTFTADAAVCVQQPVSPFAEAGCLYVLVTDGLQSAHLYVPLAVADRLATRLAVAVAEAKAQAVA